ncbi:MAG: sensor histidine kinase, partial [Sciscionella sp.]
RRGRIIPDVGKQDPDEFNSRQWPDWSLIARPGSASRRGRLIGNISALPWLLFMIYAVQDVRRAHLATATAVLVYALYVLYVLGYLHAFWFGPRYSRRDRVIIIVGQFVLGVIPVVLLRSPELITYLTYAVSPAIMLLPLRVSRTLGLATAAAQILSMWLVRGSVDWGLVWILIAVTLFTSGAFALVFTISQLRLARDQIGTLAVAQERERVARDLHDILGHSLTTLGVKAGLARRMLETTDDRDSAIAEMHDIERLARQALSDVRNTVSDYRTVSLAAEVAGARVALRAAGIEAELPRAVDNVRPELQTVFGYVVREAVTNVLRHSSASRCQVTLGENWVEIDDNGSPPVEPKSAAGNGLIGLSERLAQVDGELITGPSRLGGFRLLARTKVALRAQEGSAPDLAAAPRASLA